MLIQIYEIFVTSALTYGSELEL